MSDKPIIVQGDYYEQKGNFGAGNVKNSEIKGEAKLGGVINEAEQEVEATQQDQKQLYEITVRGEFDEINRLDILKIKHELTLKLNNKSKLKDSSIKFLDGEEGSIKLVFEGSEEELKLLNALLESGEITQLGGRTIENARLIDSETEAKEIRNKVDKKTKIIEEIRSQNIEGRKLAKVDLKLCDLSHIFLRGADLSGASLSGAALRGADLRGADLSVANLRGAFLIRAYLSGADLIGAYLSVANLRNADLSEADLSGADLIGAYLRGANLRGAYLRGANLRNADLRNADLSGAYLMGADLSRADLREADLRRADLRDANVENAIFSDNTGIAESLKQELIDKGAKFQDAPGDRSKVYTRV